MSESRYCPNDDWELEHVATGDVNATKPQYEMMHPERRPTLIVDVWRCPWCDAAWHTVEGDEELVPGNPFDL